MSESYDSEKVNMPSAHEVEDENEVSLFLVEFLGSRFGPRLCERGAEINPGYEVGKCSKH